LLRSDLDLRIDEHDEVCDGPGPDDHQQARPVTGRPEPAATGASAPYWDGAARGELMLQRSVSTGQYVFYPRAVSPFGVDDSLEWVRASGRATLASYVISARPARGFTPPYVIAVVQLEEGPRMLSTVVGVEPTPENLVLDMPLQVEFETREETTVPVFRPLAAGA
jgi:uncharacterized protein